MPWFDPAESDLQLFLLLIPGVPTVLIGLLGLLALPLAVRFEVRAASRRRRGVPTLWDQWPSVSVIVAAHNASGVIDNCVRSVGLTRYARYELILIDDGSTDSTGDMMASSAAGDPRIKVLQQPRRGRAAARNLGVRHAAGDVVIFVDADATFSPRTVDHMLKGFEDPRTGAVCGEDQPVRWNQGGLLAAIDRLGSAMSRRALTEVGGLPFRPGGIEAFPSSVLAELGPFREAGAGAELELVWRVHRAGYRVAFAPLARVHIAAPSTLRDLWGLRSRRARGLLHTVLAHRGLIGTPWQGLFLRHERLVAFVPVYSVFTALAMAAGLARQVRALAGRPAGARQVRALAGRPAGARPAGGDPATSRPAGGDPATSRPAGADPATSRPAGADPATPPGTRPDRDDDAWRALREAWA